MIGIQKTHHLLSLLFVTFSCALLCHSVYVSTAGDLISLFQKASGSTLDTTIVVTADLDFSSSTLTLPLGVFSNGTCVAFSGVFQANGHSIKSLKMNNQNKNGYAHAGLFCSLKDAIIENLVIDSSCSFTGSAAGALSVSLSGSLTVINTTNQAVVSGTYKVGGFIGYMEDLEQPSVVSFEDCANDANVTGSGNYVGGFVGNIDNSTNIVLTLSKFSNNGFVTGNHYVGGFVGYVYKNTNMTINISNSANNCNTIGSVYYVGGFVGEFNGNTNMTVTISNSTNNGNVTQRGSCAGGFIGFIIDNTDISMTISNSINNGNIDDSGEYAGGFAGHISSSKRMTITISNSTNNGAAIGKKYVGGFLGYISSSSQSYSVSLEIINSANRGSVSAKIGMACGFVCINSEGKNNVKTTNTNSINKGTVRASASVYAYAYGITNIITAARNVVSMGEVVGSSGSYTFWDESTDARLLYGLRDKCFKCSASTTLFQRSPNKEFYEVVESSEVVHNLLNDEAVNQHFGMVWSSELELVNTISLTVNVSGLCSEFLTVESGTPLGNVGSLSQYFNNEAICVGNEDSRPRIPLKPTFLVSRNMNVAVGRCMNVSVGAPINKSERMVAGEKLEQLARFFSFSLDKCIVVANESKLVLNESSVIEGDTVLKLCHNVSVQNASKVDVFHVEHQQPLQSNIDLVHWAKGYHLVQFSQNSTTELFFTHNVIDDLELVLCSLVTATGEVNTTVLVECGKQLGDTVLGDFFKLEKYFEVRDASNFSRYYAFYETLYCDINVTIIDQCSSLAKERCLNTGGVCKWNNNDGCSRNYVDEKGNAGVIVGASVGASVVFVAVLLVLGVIVAKKKKERNMIKLGDTGLFQTMKDRKNTVSVVMDGKDTVLELVEEVGHGSYATVWRAQPVDICDERKEVFAVKVVDGRRPVSTEEAQKEAMMMKQLDKQFVVAVYGCGYTGEMMAIAMEYFAMGSLQNVLQEDKLPSNGRVPMLLDIAKAMAYLHSQNIIHRDLKPGNVLVCSIDPQNHPMAKFVSFSFHHQQEDRL